MVRVNRGIKEYVDRGSRGDHGITTTARTHRYPATVEWRVHLIRDDVEDGLPLPEGREDIPL